VLVSDWVIFTKDSLPATKAAADTTDATDEGSDK
jgi:hypothetical protein